MMAEPLVMAQHPLSFKLIAEVLPAFARSADAAACPRLRPRKGQQLGGTTPQALTLSFTRWSANHYKVSGGDAATLRSKASAVDHAAVCAGHVMTAGRHAAEFTVGEVSFVLLGLGVDDSFVILGCFEQTNPRLAPEERVSIALGKAAVSITVTSLTDFVAFGISISTALPALSYFCACVTRHLASSPPPPRLVRCETESRQ